MEHEVFVKLEEEWVGEAESDSDGAVRVIVQEHTEEPMSRSERLSVAYSTVFRRNMLGDDGLGIGFECGVRWCVAGIQDGTLHVSVYD